MIYAFKYRTFEFDLSVAQCPALFDFKGRGTIPYRTGSQVCVLYEKSQ